MSKMRDNPDADLSPDESPKASAESRRYLRQVFQDPLAVGPTDEEVDEWAARERKRRQAWLNGPTEQEKKQWAVHEWKQRMAELEAEVGELHSDRISTENLERRIRRDWELSRLGAISLLSRLPSRLIASLLESGLSVEEETRPKRRSRVTFEDDL